MSWKNKETYEKRIAKTFFSLAEEMAKEEVKRLKLENEELKKQLLLHNVSQQCELLKAFLQYINCSDTYSKVSFDLNT